ncbi:MAG: UvrD-helicase domain-containing protein [Erysipelotrichales bacterium]
MSSYQIAEYFTNKQREAILKEGSNILVSAAAGCGKTTLMVERIIRKVMEDNVDINQLIVVTFTEAAAAELKQRLEKELTNRLSDNPEQLNRQISLLSDSYIMTFHALCFRLLKENHAAFNFDNTLQIGDGLQLSTQKKLAYKKTIEQLKDNESYIVLDDYYNDIINKNKLFEVVDSSLTTCISKGGINYFKNRKNTSFDNIFEYKDFNEILIDASYFYLNNTVNILNELIQEDLSDKNLETINEDILFYNDLINLVNNKDYKKIHTNLKEKTMFRKPSSKSDKVKLLHKEIKENNFVQLKTLYSLTPEEMEEYLIRNDENVNHLLVLVEQYHSNLNEIKKESGLLEFDDLEQLLIDLLYEDDGYSKIAYKLKDNFNEIMIDEYQDTNYIQETIVCALSNGNNVFMVGDLKQSIYRFRNATSKIFSDKYAAFKEGKGGYVIDLKDNFRSRPEVLETTNYIFKSTFSLDIGGIEYDENAKLHFGNKSLADIQGDFTTEYLLNTNCEESNAEEKYLQNSMSMAYEIENLHNEGVPFSSIAILIRNTTNTTVLADYLTSKNIPIMLHSNKGFYEAFEIKDIINLLKVLSNPYNDINLLATLRSYFFILSDNDLYTLSLIDESSYYKKLEASNFKNEFKLLNDLINYSRDNTILDIINYIYNSTEYLSYIQTHNNFEQVLININSFKQIIEANYNYYLSLDYLVDELEEGLKRNFDSALPAVLSSKQDVVNIMTIHKSKGLEFEYVFVFDNSKMKFETETNTLKVYQDQLILPYFNYQKKIKSQHPSKNSGFHPLMLLLDYKNRKEIIAEELRVLYVALTRAKYKLYIVDTFEDNDEKIDSSFHKANLTSNWLLDSATIFNYKRMLEPVLYCFQRHSNGMELRGSNGVIADEEIYKYYDKLFVVNKQFIEIEETSKNITTKNDYKVTTINRVDSESKGIEQTAPTSYSSNKLDFTTISDFNPYLQGTNTHLVLELLDFKSENIEKDLEDLILKFNISKANADGLKAFINSGMFNHIINSTFHKEYNITYIENSILHRGIIDLFVEDENTVYIIDYKSDNLSIDELIENYQDQLYAYQSMLETNKKIELYIYSIKHSQFIKGL